MADLYFVKTLLNKFKLSEIIGVSFIICCCALFIPSEYTDFLELKSIIYEYKSYFGIGFILSTSILALRLLKKIISIIKSKINSNERIGKKYLKNEITSDELNLLLNHFYDPSLNKFKLTSSLKDEGATKVLEAYLIIYRASTIGNLFTGFSFNLYPWAYKFLNEELKKGNIQIKDNSYYLNTNHFHVD